MENVKLLDCTLRDGGYDIDFQFGNEVVQNTIKNLLTSGIEIVEIGAVDFAREPNLSANEICCGNTWRKRISEFKVLAELKQKDSQTKLACMIFNVDFPFEEIEPPEITGIDMIRVVLRYSELDKSLELCRALKEKGYLVSINPAVTMRYSEEDLKKVFAVANEIQAETVCIVDTYAYMSKMDAINLYKQFDFALDSEIAIGFHAHNSLNLAYSNALAILELNKQSSRKLVIDSTLIGMGQGSGNLQTELIAFELNQTLNKEYKFESILDATEEIEKLYGIVKWGYSVENLLGALNKTVYKYPRYLRRVNNYSYSKIHQILQKLPENLRHRFTQENVEELIKLNA